MSSSVQSRNIINVERVEGGRGGDGGEGGGTGGGGGLAQVAGTIYNYHGSNDNTKDRRSIIGKWLTSLNFKATQLDVFGRQTDGTCQWFLESSEFKAWNASAVPETLLCTGDPGAGKSVLSAIVVDHLGKTSKEGVTIACIYCNFKEQDKYSVRELIASLLKQLVQDHPVMLEVVGSLYDKHYRNDTHPPLGELTETLRKGVERFGKVFIIIDALDELVERDRWHLVKEVQSLGPTVNLMVTSRPLSSIVQMFEGTRSIDIRANEEDVREYLEQRIDHKSHFSLVVKADETLRKDIIDKVSTNARGMFLLARLHMDMLVIKRTVGAVRAALDVLPADVNKTYEDAMDRIKKQDEESRQLAELVLIWIIYARRPLSAKELQHAVATSPGMLDIDPDSLVPEEILTSVCAGLVIADENSRAVRLVHYTAQEYFENNGVIWFPDAETNIAHTCLTYLSFDAFGAPGPSLSKKYPLLIYAALHWGNHASRNDSAMSKVQAFLLREQNVAFATRILLDTIFASYHTGFSEIHLLSYFGLDMILHWLLTNAGPDYMSFFGTHGVDSKDNHGRTPISYAAEQGHLAVVQLLLQRGATVNSKDTRDRTPLLYAAKAGESEVVCLLLERSDINVNSKDESDRTPLSYAAEVGNSEAVSLLLERSDIDVNSKDWRGRTPLSFAAKAGHSEVVWLLLERISIDVNSGSNDAWGQTPLSYAAEAGNSEAVRLLLERCDIDVNSQDNWGRTPLSYAVKAGKSEAVRLLLERSDINVNSQDEWGRTPLSYAAQAGNSEVIRLLLERSDINVNSQDVWGRTLLSRAAKAGKSEAVRLLVE